jgi:hypothetical protein
MTKVICIILYCFLTFWVSAVPAVQLDTPPKEKEAHSQDELSLIMSKDDSACRPLLNIMNRYRSEYDRIPSQAQGGDLTLVSWKPIDLHVRNSTDQIIETAVLDIDNDGKKDLVVKVTGFMHSKLTDSLHIFPPDSDVLSKLRPGPGGLGPLYVTPDKIDFSERGYVLKDLPSPIREKLMADLKKQLAEPLKKGLIKAENLDPAMTGGPGSVLQPFVWKNTVYINMTNLHQEWIVLSKYKSGGRLVDICYFHGPDLVNPE